MPSPKSAYKLWLRLQCQLITHTSAGILVHQREGRADQVVAQWPEGYAPAREMLEGAREVLNKQRLHLRPLGEELLLGYPLMIDGRFWGSVVLHIKKRQSLDLQATLKLLQWGMTWLQYTLHQQQGQSQLAELRSSDLLELLNSTLRENTLAEAAITLTNQLATRFGCQRVSLGLCRSATMDLSAVSFSANFDSRTSEMQALTDAMQEAVEQRRHLLLPPSGVQPPEAYGELGGTPELVILRAHEHLHKVTGAGQVSTFIMRRGQQVLGAVTFERDEALDNEQIQWLDQALALMAPVFDLKQAANPGFRRSATSALTSNFGRWLGPNHLFSKLAAVGLVALIALCVIPASYWISGDAVLENIEKHVLVAPQDGYLASIDVRPGEQVQQGQLLGQLNDDDLSLERRRLMSQLQQYRQEYDNALANGKRTEAAIANAQMEQAQAQLQLLEQQLTRVRLVSPINGMVVSGDISQSLGAPVEQGELLFEIAAESGYRVQLYVDERDITGVDAEQRGRLVLTSLPGEVFDFQVERVTPVSEVREGRNYFRVEALLQQESPLVRPGMTGSGKVLAGKRALGWIWFHDLWDWLRLKLWL